MSSLAIPAMTAAGGALAAVIIFTLWFHVLGPLCASRAVMTIGAPHRCVT